MAVEKYLQGQQITYQVDTTELGTVSNFKVEIAQNKITKYTFLYPYPAEPNENEKELTKDGAIFSGTLTSEMTSTMRGLFTIEVTNLDGVNENDKGGSPFIIISEEAL